MYPRFSSGCHSQERKQQAWIWVHLKPGLCAGKGRETFGNLQDVALETAIIAHLFIPERKPRCSDGECHGGAAFRRPHSAARTMDVEGAHSLTGKAICFTSEGRIHEGDSGQCCRGPMCSPWAFRLSGHVTPHPPWLPRLPSTCEHSRNHPLATMRGSHGLEGWPPHR